MGFEVFDLKQAIREYNASAEGERKPISTDEAFGVFSFSQEFTSQILQTGIEAYQNSKFHHTGITGLSKQIVANLNQSVEEFCSAIGTSAPEKRERPVEELGQAVRDNLRAHHESHMAQKQFQRRQESVELLLSPELWEEFAELAKDNAVKKMHLEEVKTALQQHGRFCTHAHASLLVAYDILSNFGVVLAKCRADFESAKKRRYINRLPSYILQAWERHLVQQEAVFRKECDDIVVHMQSRLSVAAQDPALKSADVLSRFVDLLKSKGLIKETTVVSQIRGDELTEEQFVRFHSIVEKHGNEQTRKKLFELPWFGGLGSEKKSLRENLADRYEVSSLVPKRPRIPQFLFFGTNLRFNWFENYTAQARIDAALKKVETHKTILTSFHERLPNLVLAENEFRSEEQRIEKAIADCKKGIRRFFTGKTVKFLESIRQKLNEQRLTLVREKVEALAGIVNEMESPEDQEDTTEDFNPVSYMSEIKSDVENLEGFFRKVPDLKENISKKLGELRQTFQEQKTLVEKRLRILKARQEELYELAEKEKHEEALLAPFYSENGATPQEVTYAFDYLEIAVNSVKPEKFSSYVKEIKEIYAKMKEQFVKNLGDGGDVGKLAQCALFLNCYKELSTRKFLVSDDKRRTAIELCQRGDRAKSSKEAMQLFEQATEIDPNYLSAWRKMGALLWSLHKDITSSDDELSGDDSKQHLVQSITYQHDAEECFVKPLSLAPFFLHSLVRETLAEKTASYFCQWIGVSEKRKLDAAQLEVLNKTSEQTENILLAIGGSALVERVGKMKSLREAKNFNALENLAKENLLFVIKEMPFTLQDPVERDFSNLEQKLFKFIRKHVEDYRDDKIQVDVLEDMLKEIIAHRAFEYKDLDKLIKNKDYLEQKPELHYVLAIIAKLRYEKNQIAGVVDPSDKKARVKDVNKFFTTHQQKRFFEVKTFPRASKKKLTDVLKKHGSFGVCLDKIRQVKTAVKSVVNKR